MPPRLPRLTLFTGANCSLCQVAKAELMKVRITHPFCLNTIDIYSEEGAPWRNQYAWWIPALHLEDKEIAKGRWDGTVVRENLDIWHKRDPQPKKYMTAEELAWTTFWGGYVYDRSHPSVLGADTDVETTVSLDRRNRCFNCGSPEHIVSACTELLDRSLIALSRDMHNFFRTGRGPEPQRLHEYEERKAARLRFCDAFDAGDIRGTLLQDALGLNDVNSTVRDFPWFERMLQWGYPPGWVSPTDPKLRMRARIYDDETRLDDSDAVLIIDNLPPISDAHSVDAGSCSGSDAYSDPHEEDTPSKRWVHYPTTLFSSEKLQVYSGSPLPPLTPAGDSTFNSQRRALWDRIVNGAQSRSRTTAVCDKEYSLPPWRRADAFSAFGPAGWQEYVTETKNISPANIVNFDNEDPKIQEDKSDMDVSD